MTHRQKLIILSISILLFIISLFFPAFYIDRSDPDGWANSFGLLLIGWMGTLLGGAGIAWLANPFIILSWFFVFKNPKISAILSSTAFLFAVSFLLFTRIISDEGGNYSIITDRGLGYWLWLTSIVLFAAFAIVEIIVSSRKRQQVLRFDNF